MQEISEGCRHRLRLVTGENEIETRKEEQQSKKSSFLPQGGKRSVPIALSAPEPWGGWQRKLRLQQVQQNGDLFMSDNPVFLVVGDYESVDDAKADLEDLKQLHREHVVGTYDAAVLTKNEEGKVEIVDKIEKPTQHGGWAGLAVGAALGLIFPPSILVSGLVGAGAGALIGHLEGGMSRSDLKEIGETLDESEAALIVVGEATIERAVDEATKRAKKAMKKEVRVDAKEIERAIDTA